MRNVTILVLIAGFLFIIGCGTSQEQAKVEQPAITEPATAEQAQEVQAGEDAVAAPEESVAAAACTTDSDCATGKCIDLACGQLEELYENYEKGCTPTCRVTSITVTTSDGQRLEMVAGKGSYTAAGALQWKVESSPKHCEGQEPRVPIEITKYNYGQKVSQELITLAEGETSRVLKHPTISSVAFTLKADDLTVEC